jgi:hypothetical protein
MGSMQCTVEPGINPAPTLGPRKTTENPDRAGWPQDPPDAHRLPASSLALNPRALTIVPICAAVLFFCFVFLTGFFTIIVMCICT